MRVLFDTNVLLDFLLDREPFAEPAARLLSRVERGGLAGYVCANSLTTIYYLARKAVGSGSARGQVEGLMSLLEVAPVNRPVLEGALELGLADYEDAVIAAAAALAGVQAIVTRNEKDFAGAAVPVYAPSAMLALLEQRDAE